MSDYPVGTIKDNGKTGDERMIAIRSGFKSPRDWYYMSTSNGGGYLPDSEVKDWNVYEENILSDNYDVGAVKTNGLDGAEKYAALKTSLEGEHFSWGILMPNIGGTYYHNQQVQNWSNI